RACTQEPVRNVVDRLPVVVDPLQALLAGPVRALREVLRGLHSRAHPRDEALHVRFESDLHAAVGHYASSGYDSEMHREMGAGAPGAWKRRLYWAAGVVAV